MFVCVSAVGPVFVTMYIAVPQAERRVQRRTEIHEHWLHRDVHHRDDYEDRRFRRQGNHNTENKKPEIYINNEKEK